MEHTSVSGGGAISQVIQSQIRRDQPVTFRGGYCELCNSDGTKLRNGRTSYVAYNILIACTPYIIQKHFPNNTAELNIGLYFMSYGPTRNFR
jgi:hypothetical protein